MPPGKIEMKHLSLLLLLLLVGCSATSNSSTNKEQSPKVTQQKSSTVTFTTVDDAVSAKHQELPCITLREAKSVYAPPELYSSSAKCVREGRIKDGAQVYFLAGAFAAFDAMRVNYPEAIKSKQVLIIDNFKSLDAAQMASVEEEMNKVSTRSSPEIDQVCEGIIAVGKPNYHPQYMIIYGLASWRRSANGASNRPDLTPDYDADANWARVISLVNCP